MKVGGIGGKLFVLFLGLVLICSMVLVINPVSADAKSMTLKVAHVVNTDHPYHMGLMKFQEIIQEKTKGAIKVEIYPSGQLGNERDTVEALQMGTLDMCLACTAPLTGFEPQFMLFDLPFLFKNKQHAYAVLDGEIGDTVLAKLESKGIKGLSYFEVGFRNFTNSKHPINKPGDISGLKFRLMETPVHLKSVEVWGGIPTPMAIGEVFTALQQGTIDGQENPLPIIDTFKFYEVQKYLSVTEHFYSATPLLIQKKLWDKISKENQAIILEAANAGRDVCRMKNAEKEEMLLEHFRSKGMEINYADKDAFFEASKQVYDFFEDKLGKDNINKIIAIGENF